MNYQPKRDRPRLQHLARSFALGRELWAELRSEARRTGWPLSKLMIYAWRVSRAHLRAQR